MRRVLTATILLGAMVACTRIPPRRVLPNTVNAIYIPTFKNMSYEPGLEEKITRLTQEEFLSDGRLDVVTPARADVVLVGTIEKFDVSASRFSYDDFPLTSRLTAVADVLLYDPLDRQRQKPLMTWTNIDIEYSFVSDARRVIGVIPDDAYEDALRLLARRIVLAVITQRPTKRAEVAGAGIAPLPAPPRRDLGREKGETRFQDIVSTAPLPLEEVGTEKRPDEK